MKKRGKSFKKEEFKTKICGCQYFVVVLLCYNRIFQIELVLINGLKNTLTKMAGTFRFELNPCGSKPHALTY